MTALVLENAHRWSDAAGPSFAALRARLARELDELDAQVFRPPAIPDHTLVRCIGRGACGQVWLARNALGTPRAVKIIYRAQFKEDRPYEREFEGILKYEPISRTHEGLVQVLHVGRKDDAGCFYYVMELADDALERGDDATYQARTLKSDLANERRLPPSQAAQLTLELVRALRHLHAHGLVHRDIKPSNVIFVDGRPKLADIGLVTDIGGSASFVGTEGFIPPEGPGTPQADLFALGKLLYESMTGKDRLDFPDLPAGCQHWIDSGALLELNEIVVRACAPTLSNRYSAATELEAELNLFLAGRSLRRARQLEGYVARAKRWAVAGAVLLTITAAALWFSQREARHLSERAEAANDRALAESRLRRRAEAAERASEQRLYTALLEQARAVVRSGDMGQRVQALDAIHRAAAISNRVELRREVLSALALPDLKFEREMPAGAEAMFKALDPSFERMAVFRGSGPVEIRASSDNRLLAKLPAEQAGRAYVGTWSHDGEYLAVKRDHDSAGFRNHVEVWSVAESRPVLSVLETRWDARAFHPRGRQIATAHDGAIAIWNLEDGTERSRVAFGETPQYLAYAPDGERIAAATQTKDGCHLHIRNLSSGEWTSLAVTNRISVLQWHPNGRWLTITDFNGDVYVFDTWHGTLRALGTHKAEAATAVFSPDGDYHARRQPHEPGPDRWI